MLPGVRPVQHRGGLVLWMQEEFGMNIPPFRLAILLCVFCVAGSAVSAVAQNDKPAPPAEQGGSTDKSAAEAHAR